MRRWSPPHVCFVSHVTCRMSNVTFHMSHDIFFVFFSSHNLVEHLVEGLSSTGPTTFCLLLNVQFNVVLNKWSDIQLVLCIHCLMHNFFDVGLVAHLDAGFDDNQVTSNLLTTDRGNP